MRKEIVLVLILVVLLNINFVFAKIINLDVGDKKTVEVDGEDYEIFFEAISDEKRPKVKIEVNGESEILKRGEIEKIDDIYVYIINATWRGENKGSVKMEVMEDIFGMIEIGVSEKIKIDGENFDVTVDSISSGDNPKANIIVEGDSEIFREGEEKRIGNALVRVLTISRIDQDEGFVVVELKRIVEAKLELDDQEEFEIGGQDYDLELEEISDDGDEVEIDIDGEIYEFTEGETRIVDDMKVIVKTIFLIEEDEEGYVIVELSEIEDETDEDEEEIIDEEDEEPKEEPEEIADELILNEPEEILEVIEEPIDSETPEVPITGAAVAPPEPMVQETSSKKKSGIWGWVIVILVIMIVGLLAYRNRNRIRRRLRGLT